MLEKLKEFPLTGLITLVLLMWKWISVVLRKNHLLRCWGLLPLLNWIGALTLSLLLKLPPRKLEPWFILWSFFLLKLLCISINLPYAHAWNSIVTSGLVLVSHSFFTFWCSFHILVLISHSHSGARITFYLELLDKLQKRICRTVGPSLATSLEALAHRRNVASWSPFYRYYFGRF